MGSVCLCNDGGVYASVVSSGIMLKEKRKESEGIFFHSLFWFEGWI